MSSWLASATQAIMFLSIERVSVRESFGVTLGGMTAFRKFAGL